MGDFHAHPCGLKGFGQAGVVVDTGVEDGDARGEQGETGLEGGDAAGEGGCHYCCCDLGLRIANEGTSMRTTLPV